MQEAATWSWADALRRCLDGSPSAWEELWSWAYPQILSHLTRLTRDREQADDLCQTLFLRLLDKDCAILRSFDPSRGVPLLAYLRVLAGNQFRDWRRSREGLDRRRWADLESLRELLPGEGRADQAIDVREILDRITLLPGRDRMILRLRGAGYDYGEIAKFIGVTPGGAASLLSRARARLADLLERPLPGPRTRNET